MRAGADLLETGDLLFVAAGVEHRFEAFTEDFALWRVFYGAQGGEVPSYATAGAQQ